MAGMKHVSDNDISRLIFEDSEVEGEFSDESEHEETLPVCSVIVPVNLNIVMKKNVTIIRNL
jgi:hypothetical protein